MFMIDPNERRKIEFSKNVKKKQTDVDKILVLEGLL